MERRNFWQSLKKICIWFRATLKLHLKVASYPGYQNSILRKYFTVPFLKYKRLKLNLRVFLAGHIVAMVTYYVTKTIPTCSPTITQFFDTMVVASSDNEW